nr:cell division protein ZapE [Rhodococcus sp. ZPP]
MPTDRKMRMHFHEFFRDLHLAIRRHGNDLAAALDELLGGLDLVCFDEFHVHDPADGRFIARLLPALLEREIRVILTSNYPPRSLLPNPLFHGDFVPTIELIEQALTIITIDGPVDYRASSSHEVGFAAGWWVTPGTAEQQARLGLRPPGSAERRTLTPAGNPVHVRRATGQSLWVDFADLCENTTAPVDYLALTQRFRQWVISDVPDLRASGREPAQRFANVVDVLYDRDITSIFLVIPDPELAELIGGSAKPS